LTCIVGLVHEGVVYIGGDSLGSNGYSGTLRRDKKVFHLKGVKDAVIGYTSSFRMGQLLMYKEGLIDFRDIYAYGKNAVGHEYLVTKFIPNVISLLEEGGYSKSINGEKSGGEFLFGYKDRLYKIESDFQVAESLDSFDACGSGEEFALGSLYSTIDSNLSPIERVHKALKSASHFSVGVSAPFYILNTLDNEIVEFIN
jgi:ATP-dependent protease HslVU (ClpYQ) peptidase subunit